MRTHENHKYQNQKEKKVEKNQIEYTVYVYLYVYQFFRIKVLHIVYQYKMLLHMLLTAYAFSHYLIMIPSTFIMQNTIVSLN